MIDGIAIEQPVAGCIALNVVAPARLMGRC